MANWLAKTYWNAFTLWHAREEKRLPYRSMDELLAIQNRRVRAIVAHAYDSVPHYHALLDSCGWRPQDFHSAADLHRLPVVTGAEVAAAPERFLSRRYAHDGLRVQSSGTMGKRKYIRYNTAALFYSLAHGHRQRVVLAQFTGRTLRYREMSAVRSQSVSQQMRDFYEAYSWTPRAIDFRRGLLPADERFEDTVARINAFRPDVIRGYGSHLGPLFRWVAEHGVTLCRPKAILYGADPMPAADRRVIEKQLGIAVLSSYQAVEALRLGFQCERREGFHLHIDGVDVWVRGPDGKAVEPGGSGELILSNLTNRATVLLNYRLGDVVTLARAPCACGRTLPTIERIDGRADDVIVLPDGQVRHSLVVLHRLSHIPGLVQVQVVQEDLRRFGLRVVCAAGSDWDSMRFQLTAALQAMFGGDVNVEAERVDAIPPEPGGKVRAVISRCRDTASA